MLTVVFLTEKQRYMSEDERLGKWPRKERQRRHIHFLKFILSDLKWFWSRLPTNAAKIAQFNLSYNQTLYKCSEKFTEETEDNVPCLGKSRKYVDPTLLLPR